MTLHPCPIANVDEFIRAHYLHKRPAVVVLALSIQIGSERAGCIVFSLPPRETCKRYGGLTWELARLYLLDSAPRFSESKAISLAVRHIRAQHPEVRCLVSYADPSAGHKGTIYQAANWLHDGRTDDERKSPRCDYEADGRRYSRRAHVPPGTTVTRVPRVSKHRYYLRLAPPSSRSSIDFPSQPSTH